MNFEKIRKYSDLVVLIIGASFLAYLFFKHVLLYLMPFLIGWFIAFAMRPPAAYLSTRLKIKPRVLRLILTVLLYLVLLGLLSLGVWLLSREVWELLAGLGEGDSSLEEFISGLMGSGGFFGRLFGDFGDYVADALYRVAMSMLSTLGSALSAVVSAVPKAMFFLLISVIASGYFAIGLEEINRAVKGMLPRSVFDVIVKVKNGFLDALLKYMRSYLLLLGITFLEMLVGLFLIRAPYPLIMAIVIALLDLLPVIGVGAVLIPWGIWSFFVGKASFGIGLIVLFVAHTVFRQVIEPKIIGKNLGVHPLLTLVFIYVGYSIFGIVGLLLVPIFTVLVDITFGKNNTAKVTKNPARERDDTQSL